MISSRTFSFPTKPAPRVFTQVTLSLREEEMDVLLEMLRASGKSTLEGTIRTALSHHARHLGLDVPRRIFELTPEPELAETVEP